MSTLSSTKSSRSSSHRTIAAAALAIALATPTVALAQGGNPPPPNTVVIAPKQVGLWSVAGYSEGYCAAERPVPGAAGGGLPLQFVVARVRTGYRIALAAQHWELKPQTAFPVELIAQPVMRSEASAMAGSPKLVFIELGADGQFMKKLATAPKIEVKAAQATFTLPMEQFADALAAVDNCYGSLKQPSANPFAPPEAPAKTASTK
jgi:hypothetical protein